MLKEICFLFIMALLGRVRILNGLGSRLKNVLTFGKGFKFSTGLNRGKIPLKGYSICRRKWGSNILKGKLPPPPPEKKVHVGLFMRKQIQYSVLNDFLWWFGFDIDIKTFSSCSLASNRPV